MSLAHETERLTVRVAVSIMRPGIRAAATITRMSPFSRWIDEGRARLGEWNDRARDQGAAAGGRVIRTWDSLLQSVLAEIVRHIDLDGLAASIDLDAIAERIDVSRVIDRIDVNALAQQVDVEAILRTLDLAGLTHEFLDQVRLEELIRDSSGSLAVEMVDSIRARGAEADSRVSRLVDHLLGRSDARDLRMDDGDTFSRERDPAEQLRP